MKRPRCLPAWYFYPRSPCGERRHNAHIVVALLCISIHALLAESDTTVAGQRRRVLYFYPRSPCGERLHSVGFVGLQHGISIHALLAESDDLARYLPRRLERISIHALLAESD